jgi:hypothetical protein
MMTIFTTYLSMLLGATGMILLIRWLTAYRLLMTLAFVGGLACSTVTGVILCWPAFDYIWGGGVDASLFPPQVPDHWVWVAALAGAAVWAVFFIGAFIRERSWLSRFEATG